MGTAHLLDSTGAPLVMYHGQPRPIDGPIEEFSSKHPHDGIYFTSDPSYAGNYAVEFRAEAPDEGFDHFAQTGVIYPVFLRMENPLRLNGENAEHVEAYTGRVLNCQELQEHGYDGVVLTYADGEIEAMAFSPKQICSVFAPSPQHEEAEVPSP